jgi:hypothetical protein
VAGAAADPDHDQVGNLLEYALGGDPTVSDSGFLPTLQQNSYRSEFRFSRNPELRDLRMVVQVASDLDGAWTDAAESAGGAPFVASVEGVEVSEREDGELRVVGVSPPQNAPLSRIFLRLRVELIQ